jgi:hypothetical protein
MTRCTVTFVAGQCEKCPSDGCNSVPQPNARSMSLPQRMQRWRESRADVDITIPHEHSSTGMENFPLKSPQFCAANKQMYGYGRSCAKALTSKAGKPCVAPAAAGGNPTAITHSTTCRSARRKSVFVHLRCSFTE